MRDLSNPSRDCCAFINSILGVYVKDMINDQDYERLKSELLDVIRAERRIVLRLKRKAVPAA